MFNESQTSKMITKGCPKCDLQVPVACKACPCGHAFFSARRAIRPLQGPIITNDGETTRRRTERVKREKPNYYDALEYDNQMKKVTPRQQRSGTSSTEEREDGRDELDLDDLEGEELDFKNGSRKRRLRRKLTEEDDEDPVINLSPEKTLQYSIELAEINRKIISSSWKP